jgi:hypothetical protein
LSDGFGPLRAGITAPNEPVWIADLCSVAVGREGAKLAIPESLQLDAQDADALFDAVKPLWSDSEISALPIGLGRWRVWLDQSAQLTSITPAAASLLSVSDWWPQDASMKAWRKLLNEIQMVCTSILSINREWSEDSNPSTACGCTAALQAGNLNHSLCPPPIIAT